MLSRLWPFWPAKPKPPLRTGVVVGDQIGITVGWNKTGASVYILKECDGLVLLRDRATGEEFEVFNDEVEEVHQ